MRLFLPLLALVALLTACTSRDDTTAGGSAADGSAGPRSDPAGGTSRAGNDLAIEVDAGDGSAPQTWTLTCVGSAAGSHPDAEAACAHLEGLDDPFAPVPADAVCTEQYGGPQTARVTGLWGGDPVDLELSRVDGCSISQWDNLVPLVPG